MSLSVPGCHCRDGEVAPADRRRRRRRGRAAAEAAVVAAAHGLDLLLDPATDVVGEVEVVAGGAARRSRRGQRRRLGPLSLIKKDMGFKGDH